MVDELNSPPKYRGAASFCSDVEPEFPGDRDEDVSFLYLLDNIGLVIRKVPGSANKYERIGIMKNYKWSFAIDSKRSKEVLILF